MNESMNDMTLASTMAIKKYGLKGAWEKFNNTFNDGYIKEIKDPESEGIYLSRERVAFMATVMMILSEPLLMTPEFVRILIDTMGKVNDAEVERLCTEFLKRCGIKEEDI